MDINISSKSKPLYECFDDLNLQDTVIRGIYSYGYEKPTDIQQQVIVPISSGSDVIIEKEFSGESVGSYLIGILNSIDTKKKHVQAVIICPVREHVYNVAGLFLKLAQFTDVKTARCCGGSSIRKDFEALKDTVHVIFGTPGRINDLSSKVLDLSQLKIFCIGSLDRVLDMGFESTVIDIISKLPPHIQVVIRYDKISLEIEAFSEKYTRNAVKCGSPPHLELSLEGIKQFYVKVQNDNDKLDILLDLLECSVSTSAQVIIYFTSQRRLNHVAQQLEKEYPISCVHHGMMADEKKVPLEKFRRGDTRFLLATDYVLRDGMDVSIVSLVINYSMSYGLDTYIARVGRSGHYGKVGYVINFLASSTLVDELRQYYNTTIDELPSNFFDLL
mmetsp:Transcript_18432/g.20492  ORF Transcript_18432/g.20492 Transcript_18432/m.20492 type:complete len:388 (+) Transcript_18432:2-1165(+)